MNGFGWLAVNGGTVLIVVAIVLVLVVWVKKKIEAGQTEQVLANVWAFVLQTAQDMVNDIGKEDIAVLVDEFYAAFIADTNMAKLITREWLVEWAWALWQKYVRVQSTARAGAMAQIQSRRRVQKNR